ncbi:hypothetical protein F3B05_26320, partial [Salmonella enterica subsp. enterica serovar Typhi]|nr:hypothetical protein [Salmonella enterica subsp. enterica serovar Typhi]
MEFFVEYWNYKLSIFWRFILKKKISQFKEKYVKKEWKSKVKDIAIIGIGCRFPDAANYDEYWENLENGRFSIKEIP